MLANCSDICVVGTARSGEEALEKIDDWQPDVITLDINMPGMGGLQALEHIMRTHPLPVIMVSSLTEDGAKESLRALELGAVDFLPKQLHGSVKNISHIEAQLLAKVRAAAKAVGKIKRNPALKSSPLPYRVRPSTHTPHLVTGNSKTTTHAGIHRWSQVRNKTATPVDGLLVVFGSSTGGPKALQDVIPLLPATFPAGIVVAQHMPKFFTKPFADRLNQLSALEVREATKHDLIRPGVVLIAPGSQHLSLERGGQGHVGVRVSQEPTNLIYRPSVDVLMQSAAEIYGQHCIGVVLTGMGHDGLIGMQAIKTRQGRTIAQDEATCIVYGMPKAVIEGGCADKVVPISHVADEIMALLKEIKGHETSPMAHDQVFDGDTCKKIPFC